MFAALPLNPVNLLSLLRGEREREREREGGRETEEAGSWFLRERDRQTGEGEGGRRVGPGGCKCKRVEWADETEGYVAREAAPQWCQQPAGGQPSPSLPPPQRPPGVREAHLQPTASRPSNSLVYLWDGSAQTIALAATVR